MLFINDGRLQWVVWWAGMSVSAGEELRIQKGGRTNTAYRSDESVAANALPVAAAIDGRSVGAECLAAT